ncbi:hypothetical protein [Mycoplasma phocimorsus]|uniref:hypothetical protein n=1 Tax=Mycoplasma phocimorsus TaxID=3045839 RepID=UPI0024C06F4E|nr:hypothetical protein [Mycoplasma phocimorsus]MDJ1648722.1 hypothetical protein [Mycoplasma phocimorsus]
MLKNKKKIAFLILSSAPSLLALSTMSLSVKNKSQNLNKAQWIYLESSFSLRDKFNQIKTENSTKNNNYENIIDITQQANSNVEVIQPKFESKTEFDTSKQILNSKETEINKEQIEQLDEELEELEKIEKFDEAELLRQQELQKKLLKELEQKSKITEIYENRLKNLSINSMILNALSLGVQVGVNVYFNVQNDNLINKREYELKQKILQLRNYNNLLRQYKKQYIDDPLIDIFDRLIEIAIKRDLPEQLLFVIDEHILKPSYVNPFLRKQLKASILKEEFISPLREAIKNLLNAFRKVENTYDPLELTEQIKNNIAEIMPKLLPLLLKNIVHTLTYVSNIQISENNFVQSSILAEVIIKEAKAKNVFIDSIRTQLSKVLEHVGKWFLDSESKKLIQILSKIVAKVLKITTLTFDIKVDGITLLKEIVEEIMNDEEGFISFDKILNVLIPGFLNDLDVDVRQAKDFSSLINSLFDSNGEIWKFFEIERPYFWINKDNYKKEFETKRSALRYLNLSSSKDYVQTIINGINPESFYERNNNKNPRKQEVDIPTPKPAPKPALQIAPRTVNLESQAVLISKVSSLNDITLKVPQLELSFATLSKIIFNLGNYVNLFRSLYSKLFQPFVYDLITDAWEYKKYYNENYSTNDRFNVNNIKLEETHFARLSKSFQALFRFSTLMTYSIYKMLGKNKFLLDSRAGFNIFSLQKLIPLVIEDAIRSNNKDNLLLKEDIQYILNNLFGNYNKNIFESIWSEIVNSVKETKENSIFELLKNLGTDVIYEEKLKHMLLWGFYKDDK